MNARALDLRADARVLALTDHGVLDRAGFWRRVQSLGAAIAARPGQRWALICEDSSWFAAGLLALGNCGRTVVLPQAPQAGSLGASGAHIDAVLTDRPENFAGFSVLPAAESTAATTSAAPRLPDDRMQLEFYTSGSTGTAKCVPKAFAQLRLEVAALEHQWGALLGDAVMAGTVPHYHPYGVLFRVLWPVLSGRAFLTSMCMQPAALRAAVVRGDCAIVSSPAFLSRIADYADLPPADRGTCRVQFRRTAAGRSGDAGSDRNGVTQPSRSTAAPRPAAWPGGPGQVRRPRAVASARRRQHGTARGSGRPAVMGEIRLHLGARLGAHRRSRHASR